MAASHGPSARAARPLASAARGSAEEASAIYDPPRTGDIIAGQPMQQLELPYDSMVGIAAAAAGTCTDRQG